jgi:hypothetical protein
MVGVKDAEPVPLELDGLELALELDGVGDGAGIPEGVGVLEPLA